eukprot:2772377-Amphidinium_carterae.1
MELDVQNRGRDNRATALAKNSICNVGFIVFGKQAQYEVADKGVLSFCGWDVLPWQIPGFLWSQTKKSTKLKLVQSLSR